jgi:hypothetical protein
MHRALKMALPVLKKANEDGMFYPEAGQAAQEVEAAMLIAEHGPEVKVIGQKNKFDRYAALATFSLGVLVATLVFWGLVGACK